MAGALRDKLLGVPDEGTTPPAGDQKGVALMALLGQILGGGSPQMAQASQPSGTAPEGLTRWKGDVPVENWNVMGGPMSRSTPTSQELYPGADQDEIDADRAEFRQSAGERIGGTPVEERDCDTDTDCEMKYGSPEDLKISDEFDVKQEERIRMEQLEEELSDNARKTMDKTIIPEERKEYLRNLRRTLLEEWKKNRKMGESFDEWEDRSLQEAEEFEEKQQLQEEEEEVGWPPHSKKGSPRNMYSDSMLGMLSSIFRGKGE